MRATGSSSPIVFEALPGRRSAGAPAGHHARAAAARLGARDRARRGPAAHARVARQERSRCVGRARSWPRQLSSRPSSARPRPTPRSSSRRGSTTTPRSSTATRTRCSRSSQQLGTQVIRVNLWWGGPNGVARRQPANAANPADPAYDWATYDRTVRYAYAYKMAPIFTVLGTPSWANASAGWNVAPTNPADLQAFVTAAARRYSGKYKLPDGTNPGLVSELDRLERAEQPGVPQAPVRPRPARRG